MSRVATFLTVVAVLLEAACGSSGPPVGAPTPGTTSIRPSGQSPPPTLPPNHETSPHPSPAAATPASTAVPDVDTQRGPLPDIGAVLGVPTLYRVPTSQRVVFVSIDDGWTRDPGLVTMARAAGVPLSLFLVGQAVFADPAYWRQLAATGAVVEDHTMSHARLTTLSRAGQQSEICRDADLVARTFGRRPTLLRPPYGSFNTDTTRAAAVCRMTALVLWDVSVVNGRLHYAEGNQLRPGDIILIHFSPSIRVDFAAALRAIKASGLRVAGLEAALRPPAPSPTTALPSATRSSAPSPSRTPAPTPTPSATPSPFTPPSTATPAP